MPVMPVAIKRFYEPAEKADGYRILVDRLWPRGVKKEAAAIDLWMKEVAPSTELRTWFHKDTTQWTEFSKRYKAELKDNPALKELKQLLKEHKKITLLYTAKDEKHNHALILAQVLR
jgi:uncharacterized protein YeaO (DUF488 family)